MNLKSNWIFKSGGYIDIEVNELSSKLGISSGMSKTLLSRGISTEEDFIRLKEETFGSEDPFCLVDMEKCINRVRKAVCDHEKILIYGDYDADGVTSVALMYKFLISKGGDVDYHIPDRFSEGYGMSKEIVTVSKEKGVSLIITVDNGISAHAEIEYAASLGIDIVITDHHECLNGIPPYAYGAVNPQREDNKIGFKGYSGVGVAFMFAMAYQTMETSLDDARRQIYEKYADIAAIGTVADVMSLTGENKAIVKKGIELIEGGRGNIGIGSLLVAARGNQSKVTSSSIGFVLAPRINAAGRLSHAVEALELFLCDDYDRCCEIAKRLCNLNSGRQAMESEIMLEACTMIENGGKLNNKIIVVGSENWNHGVIGIVCSRIVEKYKRPAILFSFDGENAKGSGRSVEGFNLAKALDSCSKHIVKYGGHELAAGLTVKREDLYGFEKAVNEYADEAGINIGRSSGIVIDAQLKANELTMPFACELELLEPFGQDNPEPLFLLGNAKISEIKLLGGGKHTKFILNSQRISFEALMFNFNACEEGLFVGDSINIVFTLEVNEYMGRKKVLLNVKDFMLGEDLEKQFEYFDQYYNKGMNDLSLGMITVLPTRNECIPVYKKLLSVCVKGEKSVAYRTVMSGQCTREEYLKTRLIIDIFDQLGIIRVGSFDCFKANISVCKTDKKSDIEEAEIYKRIKSYIK